LSSKPGRFELANNGIIFLDEIGEMYPNLQAKILQVIEHKEFTKLGGRKHIRVDVQIIAATNADLEVKTKEGSFRHDLYFRLNEVCIWVPPLSARKEDIPLLVRHFVQKHGGFGVGEAVDISGDELARLIDQPWPGNVRELESTVKRWIALGDSAITFSRRSLEREPDVGTEQAQPPVEPPPPPIPVQTQRSEVERILDALEKHKWNRRKAAEELGISYQTLRRRIDKLQLDRRR
jgi:DNA-binding NtrC family response regulator